MVYIKHKNPQYNYVQKARCIHCFHCFLVNKFSPYKSYFCSAKHKVTLPVCLSCESYYPNSKYIIYDVQLKLFDNEQKSISELSTVREQASP